MDGSGAATAYLAVVHTICIPCGGAGAGPLGASIGRPLCTTDDIFHLRYAVMRPAAVVEQVNDWLWAPS